jgi:hypothetical protein
MRFTPHRFALVVVAATALGLSAACHTARASETPRGLSPTLEIVVEDVASDRSAHVARFALSIVDGKAQLTTRDGDANYDLEARSLSEAGPVSQGPRFSLRLKRSQHGSTGDLELQSAVPQAPAGRVLVAKVERPDGRQTSVTAQVR